MTLTPVRQILKDQLKEVGKLTTNGTLKGNEEFDEFCDDVLHSDSLSTMLINAHALSLMNAGSVAVSVQKLSQMPDVTGKIRSVIDSNFKAFETYLAFMFFCMKAGRKLEKDEMALLTSLDLNVTDENPGKQ